MQLIDHLEVCRRLGVKPDTWRKRVERGQAPLPHSRMGRLSYYREADILYRLRKGAWPARMKFRGHQPESTRAGTVGGAD